MGILSTSLNPVDREFDKHANKLKNNNKKKDKSTLKTQFNQTKEDTFDALLSRIELRKLASQWILSKHVLPPPVLWTKFFDLDPLLDNKQTKAKQLKHGDPTIYA